MKSINLKSSRQIRLQGLKEFIRYFLDEHLNILEKFDDCLIDQRLRDRLERNLNSINSIFRKELKNSIQPDNNKDVCRACKGKDIENCAYCNLEDIE